MRIFVDDFWISPYAMFAFVAAREKNLNFKTVPVALQNGEHQNTDFRAVSWTGKLPAMIADDGFVLSESLAMVEYLEEKFAFPNHPRILPATVEDRARARQVMAWLNSDFAALRHERSTHTVFYAPSRTPLSDAARSEATRLMDFSRRLLVDGRPHLFGAWSMADTVLAMMLQRLHASGEPLPIYLTSYVEAQWQRPSVAEWVAKPRKPYVPY